MGYPRLEVSMADAFVSYSRKDLEVANRIAATLRGGGYEIWMDSDIPGGAVWRKSVAEAIAGSKAFLLLLSSNATASDNVLNELDLAEKKGKIILPVLIAHTTIPPEMELSIGRLQRIDASTNMADAEERLLDALKKLRAVDEDDPEWKRFVDTKEGREMLASIL